MVGRRIPVTDTDLTAGECEIVLKALGSYQVHLYDQMKETPLDISSSLKVESDLATSAIKKIHRVLEDLSKRKT